MHETASFGQWRKQQRKTLDLTQENLAERLGCSDVAIRKLEAGARRPSKQVAELRADLFNVPAEEREESIHFARGLDELANPPQAVSGHRPTSNLPAQIARLIGREDVVATLRDMLAHN